VNYKENLYGNYPDSLVQWVVGFTWLYYCIEMHSLLEVAFELVIIFCKRLKVMNR